MSTCETKIVTPQEAKILRQTANFELQRSLQESNILRLQAEMDADRFIPGTPIYFAVLPDKSFLALNGNHTLEAISRLSHAIELTFIYQDVKNVQEAAALYSRMDLHKMRSWRDALRAYGSEDMLASSTTWTAAYAGALGLILQKFAVVWGKKDTNNAAEIQARWNRDLRVKFMKNSVEAGNIYVQAVGGCTGAKAIFKRAAVLAVGIEICRYQPSSGAEFWSRIAADDGLRSGEPERALLRWLRENHTAGQAARTLNARAVMLGWNAFFQNREVDHLKPGAMKDIRIVGTPWNENFDPVATYLPELVKPAAPVPQVRKRIQAGVDTATGKPMAIFA